MNLGSPMNPGSSGAASEPGAGEAAEEPGRVTEGGHPGVGHCLCPMGHQVAQRDSSKGTGGAGAHPAAGTSPAWDWEPGRLCGQSGAVLWAAPGTDGRGSPAQTGNTTCICTTAASVSSVPGPG